MRQKIKFNISASSYSTFKKSPLVFYFNKIINAKPDTKINGVYGDAGTIVHNLLEEYHNDGDIDLLELFNNKWFEEDLSVRPGFNKKTLNSKQYFDCILKGKELINNNYNIINVEEEIVLPFYDDEILEVNLKGFIDFVAKDGDDIIIGDWKTNSRVGDFSIHAKMYFLLYYKKHGILPVRAVYEYLKIGEVKVYKFSIEEVMSFERELIKFVLFIRKAGYNIEKYESGDFSGPFNPFLKKCLNRDSFVNTIYKE